MCKGLLANFLFSTLEVICLLDKDGELPFLVEEAGVTALVGVVEVGFELLGVEIFDVALKVGRIDFFFVLVSLLPLLTDLTYPNRCWEIKKMLAK